MRRILIAVMAMVTLFWFTSPTHATLWDRGDGLIYDDVLHITWLQDANYANSTMTWYQATTWAATLSYYDSVLGVYLTGWRLPQTLPVNGSSYNYNSSVNGSTDLGYNISARGSAYPGSTGSEMAYMYYNNLDNTANSTNATFIDGNGNTVSFLNLQPSAYWSGTEYSPGPGYAWVFYFNDGSQGIGSNGSGLYAWAVRPGDVSAPVPEPATMLLLSSGLLGLVALRRKLTK